MSRRLGVLGAVLAIGGIALIAASTALSAGPGELAAAGANGPAGAPFGPGMMGGGYGGGYGGPGMMGGYGGWAGPGAAGTSAPGPGEAGFVAGTQASPRVVRVIAGPGYTFTPSTITVQKGETVTFEVTAVGPLVHEFMVGPADAVAADQDGTPEVADIAMMQTKSLTYTFSGSGPYAFACHAPGHYEAGMRGTITVVG